MCEIFFIVFCNMFLFSILLNPLILFIFGQNPQIPHKFAISINILLYYIICFEYIRTQFFFFLISDNTLWSLISRKIIILSS